MVIIIRKTILITAICIFTLLVAALVSAAIFNDAGNTSVKVDSTATPSDIIQSTPTASPTIEPTVESTVTPTYEPAPTPEPLPQYTNIVVGMTGDMIAHKKLLDSGLTGESGSAAYSFDHLFKYIKPALEYPDLMIANLESPIAGEQAGYTKASTDTYIFNFPDAMAYAIKNSGIDMVLNGNNHASDRNPDGLFRTLDFLDENEIMHTGAWRSPEERAIPTVVDIQGIKVGIVSATYSLNGREHNIEDEMLSYMVCFIEQAQVKEQIDLCREHGADIVIVSPHMGYEYRQNTSDRIRKYGEAYIAMGADIVVAHHPHVLQSSELIQVEAPDGTIREGICFWSLGNFISNQVTLKEDFAREVRETGIILYINIQKDNYTGEVEIENLEYLPVWMLRRADLNPRIYAVLPAGNEIDFLSPPYDPYDITSSSIRSLERAWNLAIKQVGTEYATPLSTMPVRDDETDK